MTYLSICAGGFICLASTFARAEAPTDRVLFGEPGSEQAHRLVADHCEPLKGLVSQSARHVLPLDPVSWDGGRIGFDLKVDPSRPNYFTIKLSGDDRGADRGRLLLFCEGKQVGYRHIGDVDLLDIAADEPRFPGRFVYTTTVLPTAMTAGKTTVHLEIRGLGPIWAYGETWAKFQKPFAKESRGIYAAYTHTDKTLTIPSDEVQGTPPAPTVRTEPGTEQLDRLKQRVNAELTRQLAAKRLTQMQMQMLARAYHVKWSVAYAKRETIEKLVEQLDGKYVEYLNNLRLAEADPETWNADWFGLGTSGDVLRLIAPEVQPLLDQPIAGLPDGSPAVTRRAGYADMLVACRDWHRKHRRQYTNQSMINDLYGIYLANRGVAVVDPKRALSEDDAKRYLYESVGLQPWLDSDPGGDGAPEIPGRKSWGVGPDYMQLTAKGLTRELGYVGSYGEVIDWVVAIYNATRPTIDAPGDERIRAQLVKIAKARGIFRYPGVDADGHHAMFLESTVGWRETHYPGDVTYAQRSTWDAGPLEVAAVTEDPDAAWVRRADARRQPVLRIAARPHGEHGPACDGRPARDARLVRRRRQSPAHRCRRAAPADVTRPARLRLLRRRGRRRRHQARRRRVLRLALLPRPLRHQPPRAGPLHHADD